METLLLISTIFIRLGSGLDLYACMLLLKDDDRLFISLRILFYMFVVAIHPFVCVNSANFFCFQFLLSYEKTGRLGSHELHWSQQLPFFYIMGKNFTR